MKISILGGGSWATALSLVMADNGHIVSMWMRDSKNARYLNKQRKNKKYLSEFHIPESITAHADPQKIFADAQCILSVLPTQEIRTIWSQFVPYLPQKPIPIISASKGIEIHSGNTISQILQQILPSAYNGQCAYLSGPSFAKEVAMRLPTTVVLASNNEDLAKQLQPLLSNRHFRIYTSNDVAGIEICGAVKNVIAIAAGMVEGLSLGNNALAGLITRGIAEMTRLSVHLGGKPQTQAGLAGIGDLVLTCTGNLSRNRSVGLQLGKGQSLLDILKSMNQIAEGISTAQSVFTLSQKEKIEMPICNQVYQILYNHVSPKDAIDVLMKRELKSENE